MQAVDTRLNKGVTGRGDALLTGRQKDAIRKLAEVWRIHLDEMTAIGISNSVHVAVPMTVLRSPRMQPRRECT